MHPLALLERGLLQPLALLELEGGLLQPLALLEREPPQIFLSSSYFFFFFFLLYAFFFRADADPRVRVHEWETLIQPLALLDWEPTLIQEWELLQPLALLEREPLGLLRVHAGTAPVDA